MEKIAKMSGSVAIIVLGIVAVGMAIYSLYQQSQLYPAVHQQIGYQACVNEVNAKVAEQQKAQQVAQPNE